jgi:putative membrane protein
MAPAAPLPLTPRAVVVDAVRIALDDPTIVAIFDAANTYDIEAATLGARKGTTPSVRNYATMLVKAHTDARQQGRNLAKKLGVTPTPPKENPFAADHAAAMKTLESASGQAFDRAFLEHEVAYHKAVINAVQNTLLPAIQNQELKTLVVHVAPVFVQHEMAGEKLLAALPK